jgi:multisubunit Na+/H+ antiporter MnhF subunit
VIEVFAWPSIGVLVVSLVLCLVRLANGPSAADRLLAYGTLTSTSIGVFIIAGVVLDAMFLEALVPLALVSFVAILLVARFLEGEVE